MVGLVVIVAAGAGRDLRRRDRAAITTPKSSRNASPSCARRSGRRAAISRFLLGTDGIGRDLLSRLIYGARYSLFIGVIVVTISLAAGILFGLLSGFFRGTVDILIMRAMDIILSIPSLLLAIVDRRDPRVPACSTP